MDTLPAGTSRVRRAARRLVTSGVLVAVASASTPVHAGAVVAPSIVSPVNEPGGANAPYAVVIMANPDAGVYDPQPFCSGALIAPDLVLTAGHCAHDFNGADLYVGAGSEHLRETALHPVVDLLVHPWYNPTDGPGRDPLANDIALLRLANPVPGVKPVRLAPVDDSRLRGPGSNLRVHGWGIGSDGETSGWLGRAPQRDVTATTPSPYAELDTRRQLLTRARRGSVPCVGDSGGPLVGNRPGTATAVLVGLVSYGSEGCDPRMPVVYTRIAGQRAWIGDAVRTLRGRTSKVRLSYRSSDRSWDAPDGTRVLVGELVVTRERVRVVLSAPDLGETLESRLVVRVPSSGAIVRSGDPDAVGGACRAEQGTSRGAGGHSWWVGVAPSCLGLSGAGADVIAELVRDGTVLDEVHFVRVRVP